jgi:uncharacterized repeat protein (TIGR01451 family)
LSKPAIEYTIGSTIQRPSLRGKTLFQRQPLGWFLPLQSSSCIPIDPSSQNTIGAQRMDSKRSPYLAAALFTATLLIVSNWIACQRTASAARSNPSSAAASPGDVVINEVAWMGTSASYTDEWIELHNVTDLPIPLTNWKLTADDGTPAVTLDGVVAAKGYFLLERVDDSSVSDIPADQIYSGALENDPEAETIRLRDAGGTLIDTVNGDGGSWPAGDNATKHTMERRDPFIAGSDDNWADNDGVVRSGLDANGDPIAGTPGACNSVYIGPTPPRADVVIAKSGPATARPDDVVTYSIAISNTGSIPASDVLITDRLPSAVTFIAQDSPFAFDRADNILTWRAGDVPVGTPPLRITVTGRLSVSAYGTLVNIVSATTTTTETHSTNNSATWGTNVNGNGSSSSVLIGALLYDGYQTNDTDEAVQLINVSDSSIDLAGWEICDSASDGSCTTIVSGTLEAQASVWLAYWGSDFYNSSGVVPEYAVSGIVSGTLALFGSWPRFANTGEQVVLVNRAGDITDTVVYEDGDTDTPGWSGTAVRPWSGREGFRIEGQILYRTLDEASGLPVPDTGTAADWAQYAYDPIVGRRVRYPGWDLAALYQPLHTTESAHLTIGVAPDNAADVVLSAIDSAEGTIEIGVYALTHPTIIEKLVAKAAAGVTVTLLLEGDQAGVDKSDPRWQQQMWACQALHATGHGACWFMVNDEDSNVFGRYRFMHAKYALVDREQVLITSQNLTPGGMPDDDRSNGTHGSRGAVLLTDAPLVVARVADVFDRDLDPTHQADLVSWSPTGSDYGPPSADFTPTISVTDYTTYTVMFSAPLTLAGSFDFELLTAPEAALRQSDALLGLLARAADGDEVYVETMDERAHWGANPMDDPSLRMEAYIAAARRGAKVRILLNSGRFEADYYDASQNIAAAAYANDVARQEGLDLQATTGDPTQCGIHNKMVLVWLAEEGGHTHLGSLNGSETSNKVNREVAIQVRSDAAFAYLKRVFDHDWAASTPVFLPCLARGFNPPGPPANYPLISEVLYNPHGAEETGEWVELFNPTAQPIDLSDWRVGDVGPAGEFGSGLYRFPSGSTLPPDSTIVIAIQAADTIGFTPDFEFLADPLRDDPQVPNMTPAGKWDGFGFALGNAGDEVILLDGSGVPVDALVYGTGSYPDVLPHPGVTKAGHSLERRPANADTDDCARDFSDRYPPDPGAVSSD